MKKTVISLIIIVILGAVVFGFGYVPIRLEPGERVLLFSRTGGWDEEALYPGEFSWRWELLIPKNVTFYRFPAETRRLAIASDATLPSADLYREYLEGKPSLNEKIRLRLRYRISDTGIAQLAPMGLDAEGISAWYDDFDDGLRATALDAAADAIRSYTDQGASRSIADIATAMITERITDRFPEIDLEAVIVEELALPDIALYEMGRETYRAVQERRRAVILSVTTESAGSRTLQNERLDTLARYGEILDQHPILLDYLEIAARHGSDPLSIRELQSAVAE